MSGFKFSNDPLTAAEILHNVRKVGRYDWLGGYTHVVLLSDGEVLDGKCVRENYRQISRSTRNGESDGWRAVAVIALDDGPEQCAHCGKDIA